MRFEVWAWKARPMWHNPEDEGETLSELALKEDEASVLLTV
jgi:hypothetical protein